MKPNIYVTLPIPEETRKFLTTYCHVKEWRGDGPIPRETLKEAIKEVDGLYTSGGKIDADLLENAKNLKVVSNMSVGYNNFDIEAMKEKNVIGTNTPHVLDDSVADLALALMLASARRVTELEAYIKAGEWEPVNDEEVFFGVDVFGKKLGIIGMGRIGEAIAKRAKFGFDMDVYYHNRSRKTNAEQQYDAKYVDLDTLLQTVDFVVLMTPLTDETYRLMGEREFDLMKETGIFINVSRGQTVDEQALIHALQSKKILAAGLDVFDQEPINKDNPMLKMKNVVMVPHIGSATRETRDKMAMRAAENLVAVLQGKDPIDPVY